MQGRTELAAPPDVGDVLERLKIALHIKTDFELSKALEVSTSTVSSWKKRYSIPYDAIIDKCIKYKISPSFVLFGVEPDNRAVDASFITNEGLIYSIVSVLVGHGVIHYDNSSVKYKNEYVGAIASEIHAYLRTSYKTLDDLINKHGMTKDDAMTIVLRSISPAP